MNQYKKFLGRTDLVKNQVEREKLAEQEATSKRKRSIQQQNKQRWLKYQEQLRSELAARYFHSVVSAGGESDTFSNKYSISLDGTNDHAAIPSFTSLDGLDKFTISAWVKMPSGGGGGLMGKNNTSAYNSQRFKWSLSLGAVQAYVGNITFAASLSLSADTWYHAVWRYDHTLSGNFSKSRISINNVNVSNTNGSNTPAVVADTDPFTIGVIFRGTSSPIILSAFEGNIDEVSIWNTALSDGEITSIYNSGNPNDVSNLGINGLVNWYRMGDNDGGTGTTLTDAGSGGNNGSLLNGAAFEEDTPG